MNPGNLHSHLSADRPIQSAKEDLFRREKFAQAMAKAIRGWTGQDSLVMALYGPWGVGKTSVKNLIVESLSLDMKPRVLEFNPWEWAGRDQIQRAFFAQLTVLFGKVDPSAKGQKLVERLERYASILEGVSINDNFTRVGELIAVFIGLVTLKTVSDTFIQLPDWLQNLTSICVVILGILVCVATFFRWGFKAIVAVYKKPEQLLTEQREELRKSLQKLGAPVLIVIDDIDRLSSIEIAQVFQLVKANADFPNLVFLLLFDREVVEASLIEVTKGNPREYLEKIVQAAFTIPAASRTELDKYTFEAIQSICQRRNIA
jgi:predicted KAP-like P-loop ATPase